MTAALLLAAVLHVAPVDWTQVDLNIRKLNPPLQPVTLSRAQWRAVRPVLTRSLGDAWPGCGARGDKFTLFHTPLGSDILEVQAGRGNCRGGQGSNGALWLIEREGTSWRVLASPADGFGGWGLGVQPNVSHGLADLVVGWHMGAEDFSLSYFRFDGRRFRRVSGKEFRSCKNKPQAFCLADGHPARNTGPEN